MIISLAIITGAAAQPVFDLYPDTVLTALGDTLYLGGLQAIAYSDRYGYAFLDSDVGGLVLTDLQFRPIQRLGRFGGGPQEYPSATLLRFWGDTLVVGRRLFRLPAFEYLGQLPVSSLAIAPPRPRSSHRQSFPEGASIPPVPVTACAPARTAVKLRPAALPGPGQ